MSADMAETSVTDFFTLPQFAMVGWVGPPVYGSDHASKVVGSWRLWLAPPQAVKSGQH